MIHPETGKLLSRDVRPNTISYGIYSETFDQPGWYPEDDSDAVLGADDSRTADEVFTRLRAKYIAHLKEFRQKLGLTQEAASDLVGGGPRAFQKYESGRARPTGSALKMIELLYAHPELAEELQCISEHMDAAA